MDITKLKVTLYVPAGTLPGLGLSSFIGLHLPRIDIGECGRHTCEVVIRSRR